MRQRQQIVVYLFHCMHTLYYLYIQMSFNYFDQTIFLLRTICLCASIFTVCCVSISTIRISFFSFWCLCRSEPPSLSRTIPLSIVYWIGLALVIFYANHRKYTKLVLNSNSQQQQQLPPQYTHSVYNIFSWDYIWQLFMSIMINDDWLHMRSIWQHWCIMSIVGTWFECRYIFLLRHVFVFFYSVVLTARIYDTLELYAYVLLLNTSKKKKRTNTILTTPTCNGTKWHWCYLPMI